MTQEKKYELAYAAYIKERAETEAYVSYVELLDNEDAANYDTTQNLHLCLLKS